MSGPVQPAGWGAPDARSAAPPAPQPREAEPARLLLVRHGQTTHNVARRLAGWTDSPLSEEGRRQVERLAAYLEKAERLDALYASPLQRAWQTALAIGRRVGLEPAADDDLREFHFGDCEALTGREIYARFPHYWEQLSDLRNLTFRWPGGESHADCHARIRRVFHAIAARHPSETVAVVTHGKAIGLYLAEIVEGDPASWIEYVPHNCAVTEVLVEADGSAAWLRRWNQVVAPRRPPAERGS